MVLCQVGGQPFCEPREEYLAFHTQQRDYLKLGEEPSSFGTKQPSANFQLGGTKPLAQILLRIFHSLLSFGHCLYTLYGILLGPGATEAFAFRMMSCISCQVGSFTFSSIDDFPGLRTL